jgi:AraC-like DNA-binding protein
MLIYRDPKPELRPFVTTLWASEQRFGSEAPASDRELMLPTGLMHLAFRLSESAFRVLDNFDDLVGWPMGHAIVGGARATFAIRDVSQPARSVGAQLRPGAAQLLFGVPADELAGRYTPLGDVCGRWASEARQRLLEAGSLQQQLDTFESLLAARLPLVRGLHPVVACALERFAASAEVREVVRQSGYSHRRFIALFRRAAGLSPKTYCRVLRFRRAVERTFAAPDVSLADIALDAGYSDQPHFTREFRAFAGISPLQYRLASAVHANHVPIRIRGNIARGQ